MSARRCPGCGMLPALRGMVGSPGPGVDVRSMAASLYYMLTGYCRCDVPKKQGPVRAVPETAPVPIRERSPQVPARSAAANSAAQLAGALRGPL